MTSKIHSELSFCDAITGRGLLKLRLHDPFGLWRCYCPYATSNGQLCKLQPSVSVKVPETPLCDLQGPRRIKMYMYKCKVHGKSFNMFHEKLMIKGTTVKLGEDTERAVQECGGFIKWKSHIFSLEFVLFLWRSYIETKQYSHAIRAVQNRLWSRLSSLSRYQLKMNKEVDAVQKVTEGVLPSSNVLRRLLRNLCWKAVLPMRSRYRKALSKLGSRFVGFDATWRGAKGVVKGNHKLKTMILTVTDEFGNWFDWELLSQASESHEEIVPVIASVVMDILRWGPYDRRPFVFCSDNAERDEYLVEYVFAAIIQHNDNCNVFVNDEDKVYYLERLQRESKMSEDLFHVNKRCFRDGVIQKNEEESRLAYASLAVIFRQCHLKRMVCDMKDGQKLNAIEWLQESALHIDEDQLAGVLNNVLKIRLMKAQERNGWLQNLSVNYAEGMNQAKEVVCDIYNRVHSGQWTSLFSRWCWFDGEINVDWGQTVIEMERLSGDAMRVPGQFVPVVVVDTLFGFFLETDADWDAVTCVQSTEHLAALLESFFE